MSNVKLESLTQAVRTVITAADGTEFAYLQKPILIALVRHLSTTLRCTGVKLLLAQWLRPCSNQSA